MSTKLPRIELLIAQDYPVTEWMEWSEREEEKYIA
jgi:hypothetical protein